ncbi:hypothetical protein DQW77_17520 [Roseovarius sp. TE539]|nr:hypothetical protein DQW77_17520 [Roseovarius sp. TE539]
MTDGGQTNPETSLSLTRIRTLHERSRGEGGESRHEKWSLVEVDGERRVLFEAHSPEQGLASPPLEQRLMTLREALRGPRTVSRQIWLALED